MNVDMASFSAHKMYGPKGVGALFVSRGTEIEPLQHGGGHERGVRSGTLNVPGIVGFGSAASLTAKTPSTEAGRQSELITRLLDRLAQLLDGVELIGASNSRLSNTANIRFHGASGDAVMANAPDVMISSGSACSSMIPEPSHVLLAMGLDPVAAEECLRFSVGRPTQASDVEKASLQIAKAVDRVREIESVGN
jgi:cysteine desulfurase